MKIKVEFEFDLDIYEEWCEMKFSQEEIDRIKLFLNQYDDRLGYALRDFINIELKAWRKLEINK